MGTPVAERKHLKDPPIVEVVCGFVFEPVPGLDPVAVGLFWDSLRAEYPTKQLHPAVGMPPGLAIGLGPIRTWLVNGDGEQLLQIQQDRFYFNWRKGSAGYPHFHSYERPGVLRRCLSEFERFAAFCETSLGRRPRPTGIELSKIDHLLQGKHWRDFADLAQVVPALAAMGPLFASEYPVVQVQSFDVRDGREVHISMNNAVITPGFVRAMQIETRVVSPVGAGAEPTFEALNEIANAMFNQLVPESQWGRFGGIQ